MARGADERLEVLSGDGCGPGIGQRVEVYRIVRHQGGVDEKAHAGFLVVHQREGGDRAGRDAEQLFHQFRRSER